MDDTHMNQMHMGPYMHNAFWHEYQVCITFQFGFKVVPQDITTARNEDKERLQISPFLPFDKKAAIKAMHLEALNDSDLLVKNHFRLHSFRPSDTLRPMDSTVSDMQDDLNSEIGKYLFNARDEQGRPVPVVISFFNFTYGGQPQATETHSFAELAPMFGMPAAPAETTSISENDKRGGNGDQDNGKHPENSPVVKLVTLINDHLEELSSPRVRIVAASPV